MSHLATDEHFKQAKAWVEEYVRRNPDASVIQVARAANNMRLTVPQSVVAEVRRQVRLKEARAPFNPALRIEPKRAEPEAAPVGPKPKPPAAVKPAPVPHKQVDVGDPWARLGVAVPPVRTVAALPPPPPPAPVALPPEEPEEAGEDEAHEERRARKRGMLRKVVSRIPLDGTRGQMVDVLECGHATTSALSQQNPQRLCSTCGRDDETKELVVALKQLVKKHGFEFVLGELSKIERDEAAR